MASASLPDHKLIPQTGFIVDGFKYRSPQIKAYFLSHAHGGGQWLQLQHLQTASLKHQSIISLLHADHYTGLRENWDFGPIYCSEVTGKLVVKIVGVNPDLIRPLQWDTPTIVEGECKAQPH